MLAKLYAETGRFEQGLALIGEALQAVADTDERLCEAELRRFQGELLLGQGGPDAAAQAEACFQQSLSVARRQQAKSWELRTATSLARLWRQQGKVIPARELLAPVYEWFSEGFDTLDLQEAKRLLDELV